MMGERQVQQDALFYGFSLERHVPEKHLLRAIDRFVDLSGVRGHLAPFYSETGRPSIRRRAGPPPGVARRSTLIALIISLMWSTRLLSTWSPRRRCVKPR